MYYACGVGVHSNVHSRREGGLRWMVGEEGSCFSGAASYKLGGCRGTKSGPECCGVYDSEADGGESWHGPCSFGELE